MDNSNNNLQIVCPPGRRISDYLRERKIDFDIPCGGQGTCGHCKIKLLAGTLPVTDADRIYIDKDDLDIGFRLACRAIPERLVRIEVPLRHHSDMNVLALNNTEKNKKEIINDSDFFGIGIDIGTTTIAAALVNLTNNEIISEYTAVNRQRPYGSDVITRMKKAVSGHGDILKHELESNIIDILYFFCHKYPIIKHRIVSIAIACNTVMQHLLLGFSVEGLASSPFKPVSLSLKELKPFEFFKFENYNSFLNNNCIFTILPGIGAFIGSDISSGILSCDFDMESSPCLFIDIGTNSEIALLHNNKIYATSTPAGPAFEAGNISQGCACIPGAIYSVSIKKEKILIKTIENAPPIGVCGTGLIEAVSEMYSNGIIDSTGKLCEEFFVTGFPIYYKSDTDKVIITQDDIHQLQLAKSAIRAGIDIILKKTNSAIINKLYIAGGFGYSLDIKKAGNIGMIPMDMLQNTVFVGNSSLKGTIKYLQHPSYKERINNIVSISDEIHLANTVEFNDIYLKHINM